MGAVVRGRSLEANLAQKRPVSGALSPTGLFAPVAPVPPERDTAS